MNKTKLLFHFMRFIFCVAVFGAMGLSAASADQKSARPDMRHRHVPDEMIIGFNPGVSEAEIEAFYDAYYGAYKLKKRDDLDRNKRRGGRGKKLARARGQNLLSLMKILQADPRVEYVEPNYIYSTQLTPNDPRFDALWGLDNVGQTGGSVDADIDASEAWDIPAGSQDILVALIDSGIDYTHEDLAANLWVNPNEIPGNGVDDDNNGYIDDIHGINAITNSGDPADDNGHGTHVAGTVGAVSNNGLGVSGVSRQVKLIACKFLDNNSDGTNANATKCLHYINHLKNVLGQNIRITNNSWSGGGFSLSLIDAYDGVDQPGMAPILHVAAAGNDNRNNDVFPPLPSSINLANILSVAATDHNDSYASFTNYGLTQVDVAAPGVNILSTVPTGSCPICAASGYRNMNGTSMATPHVSGIANLLWAQDPTLSATDVKQKLMDSADPLADLSKRTVTDGRVSAFQALSSGLGDPPVITSTPLTVAEVDQPYSYQAQATGASTITWTLTTGPTGMTIDSNTGLLTWTPSATGNFPVQVQADNIVGSDTQAFAIDVTALAPSVDSFSAAPTSIASGEASTLTWTTTDASDVSIDNGVGAVAADGTAQVNPTATTTYTLTATGTGGSTTSTVTVTVNLAPSVDSFSAAPTSIASGEASTLTWSTTNASDVSIDNGVGAVAADGTAQVSPTATTTYTLTATGTGGSTTSTVTVTVNLAPSVDSFSAAPTSIASGEASTLTWSTTNASDVSIDNGVGTVAADGTAQVSPTATTTYTLTATGTGGSTTSTMTVTVNLAPSVDSFSAGPNPILSGETSTLSWTTSNATDVSIDNGVGVVAADGSVQVSPTTTTVYTLTASGPGGTVTSTASVTVNPLPPSVDSFSAGPNPIISGDTSTLTWTTSNATDVSIDNGVGVVAADGSAQVSPAVTTTYTLTASGSGGNTTASVTLTVDPAPSPAPSVDSFSAGPNPIVSGETSTLTWTTSNADAVSIDNGVEAVAVDDSVQVSPAVTTTYTLTASGPGGSTTSTVTLTVDPASSETITITKAQFRADKGEWRVQGISSIAGPGDIITLYIGPSISGTVLGTAAVNSGGPWSFREKDSTLVPDSTQTISVQSSQGGILEGINLEIRN